MDYHYGLTNPETNSAVTSYSSRRNRRVYLSVLASNLISFTACPKTARTSRSNRTRRFAVGTCNRVIARFAASPRPRNHVGTHVAPYPPRITRYCQTGPIMVDNQNDFAGHGVSSSVAFYLSSYTSSLKTASDVLIPLVAVMIWSEVALVKMGRMTRSSISVSFQP